MRDTSASGPKIALRRANARCVRMSRFDSTFARAFAPADDFDDPGTIVGTPDRGRLWQAQTPQGFPRAALVRAYERAQADRILATDDAALYERYVGPVRVVAGSYRNLKVTRPEDLRIAEALALAPQGEAGE